ncbi:MAG TPA: winged helix-turn-helix domain-containing protein [Anaerolineae bacterium]|nr:winged helix-turn-helix domain-containing protein [Anaerolineae bacterium]
MPILRQLQADVLLINVDQPEMIGTVAWAAIHFLLPSARIVALTAGNDVRTLEAALAAGVTALQGLNIDLDTLRRIVRNAAQGIVERDPQLIERVKPFLMRPSEEAQIHIGELTIDLQSRVVRLRGGRVQLTRLEFEVLAYLARNVGRPVGSDELLNAVWRISPDRGGTLSQVKHCIKRLRQKIRPDAATPQYLYSHRGWGYLLRDPLER